MGPAYYNLVRNTSGLVGYWRLGEASGVTAADDLGTNPGTYSNAPTLGAAGAIHGDPNTAMSITIAGQNYASVPNSASLQPTAGITCAGWVKTSQKTNFSYVMRKYSTAGYGLRVDSGTGSARFFLQIGAGLFQIVAAPVVDLSDGVYHFLAGTFDTTTMRLYVDGALVQSAAQPGAITQDATALYIGAYQPGPEFSTSTIDEVALLNRSLTTTEVRNIYQAA
jgi:hypothetical protein